jgi:phosphomannomutase
MSPFSENDIRGIYPDQLNRALVYRIGYYLPELLKAEDIVVGRDPRLSSVEIFTTLAEGIRNAGADVVDIGACCTPSLYFANAYYGFGASVMITASHNPPEYNGLKISGRGAVPLDGTVGLRTLAGMVERRPGPTSARGRIRSLDINADYLSFIKPFKEGIDSLHLVSDCANGAAAYRFRELTDDLPIEHSIINGVADGRFPQHGPNPLEAENLTQIREQVLAEEADLGICFDGDGDRVVFVDETGAYIPGDLITGLLGLHFFRHSLPAGAQTPKVLCDVRSSRSVPDYLRALGAQPLSCPVGHALIKSMLRRSQGLYAGELTGHYYFRDFFYCDSALIAILLMLGIVSRERKNLSELVRPLKRYFSSGELSFTAANKERITNNVRQAYKSGRLTEISGLRFDFEDWWFILRTGSTEPLLRLVVEADTPNNLSRRKAELIDLILEGGGAK